MRSQPKRSIFFIEKHYLLLLAPLLIFIAVIAIYPLLFSFYISFFKYRLTDPNQTRTFLGLANYVNAFHDKTVTTAIRNTWSSWPEPSASSWFWGWGWQCSFPAKAVA